MVSFIRDDQSQLAFFIIPQRSGLAIKKHTRQSDLSKTERNGDRAFEYYRASMPASYNDRAEIRQIEPYVQGQTTYSVYSPRPGNTRTSWLTGAAAWAYYSATQYILGLRPELDGLRVDPCIPSTWEGFTVTRRFRGRTIEIEVKNPDGVCRGVKSLTLNGETLAGNLIPADRLEPHNRVQVVLG